VLKNPSIQIEAGGTDAEFKAIPVADAKRVFDKFHDKYGTSDRGRDDDQGPPPSKTPMKRSPTRDTQEELEGDKD
jgi:hypothetical protein